MRYHCIRCGCYWADRQAAVALIQEISPPVRDCPDCLARQGYRWIDAASCHKGRLNE